MSDIAAGIIDRATGAASEFYKDAKDSLFGTSSASLRFRNIGGLLMDCVMSEEHESELDTSENRIESGAKRTDHAEQQPKKITVRGVVVGHESTSIQQDTIDFVSGIRTGDFLDNLSLPSVVSTITDSTLDLIRDRLANFIDWGGLDNSISSNIAPWLPGFSIAEMFQGSQNLRIEEYYRALLDLQKSVILCDVDTGIYKYTNMMLKSIRVSQQKDGSAIFTLSLKEFIEVPLQTSTAIPQKNSGKASNKGTTKSGRAASQGATITQKASTAVSQATGSSSNSNDGVLISTINVFKSIAGLIK